MSAYLDTVRAKLETVINRVYEVNKVPPAPAYPYLVFSVTGDRPGAYLLDASHGLRQHRITWQSFGETVSSATDLDDLATGALLDKRLAPGLGPCTADQTVLGALTRDQDAGGVVGVTSSLLFTAPPQESP